MVRALVSAVWVNFTSLKKDKNYGKFSQNIRAAIQKQELYWGAKSLQFLLQSILKNMYLKPGGRVQFKRDFFPYAMNPMRPYVCCSKLQYLQGAHLAWKSSIISFFTWMKCEYSSFFLENHYTDWIVSGSNRMGFSTQLFSTDWKSMALLVGAGGRYSEVSKTVWKTVAPVTFKNVLSGGGEKKRRTFFKWLKIHIFYCVFSFWNSVAFIAANYWYWL